MNQFITATFADGVLKPEQELGLASGTRVRLVLESEDEASVPSQLACTDLDRLCDEIPIVSTNGRLTRDQLHERR